jgi:Cytochrome P460
MIHVLNPSKSRSSKQSAEEQAMKTTLYGVAAMVALVIAVVGGRSSSAQEKQDKYTLQIPGGLAFSEIRGYEQWQVVGPSLTEAANVIRVILANPVMIKAYQEGVPGNGKPFPDGSKIVKLEWRPKKITDPPFSASTPDTVPGDLPEVEFIEKDSKRFSDTHGWGYAMFDYDAGKENTHHETSRQQASPDHWRHQRHRPRNRPAVPGRGRPRSSHWN